jgi:chromate transporter
MNDEHQDRPPATGQVNLSRLSLFFLRLGTMAFGGPAAHFAMMEDELVRRRGWVPLDKFLDMLGAANLIPGPSSTEMAIFTGYLLRGPMGLLLSGVCFIVPAMIMVLVLAWAYARYGNLPQVAWLLYGVKPVVIAIVLQALLGLGRTAVKNKFMGVMAAIGIILSFLGTNPLVLLSGTGLVTGLRRGFTTDWRTHRLSMLIMSISTCLFLAGAYFASGSYSTGKVDLGLLPLFLFFLKIGSVVFGSGYVLLAFLHTDLVDHWHWLTTQQLLDAIAVGQVTPGPVFTTATFIGYLLAGLPGALIATVGIFLPSFIFVAIGSLVMPLLRRSAIAGAFLDGVIVASLALMAAVTWNLGRGAIVDLPTSLLAAGSAFLLIRFRWNSLWLVLCGALIGTLVCAIRFYQG